MRNPMRNPSHFLGFILLEVWVAIAVVAIALLAIMVVIGREVRSLAQIENKIAMHQVSMNALGLIQIGAVIWDANRCAFGHETLLNHTWDWEACIHTPDVLQVRVNLVR